MGNTFVHIVPYLGATDDPQVVYQKLEKVLSEDYEGLMLNTFNGLYKFGKRSSDVLKVKGSYTCDLKCIAIEEGDGKYKGTLGKLVVDYKGFEVRVGSGLTDEERDNIWNNPESAIGHLIEVKYMQESKDENGDLSLRHPVFIRIRDDKDDISYE
jgi:DNA ligase-1